MRARFPRHWLLPVLGALVLVLVLAISAVYAQSPTPTATTEPSTVAPPQGAAVPPAATTAGTATQEDLVFGVLTPTTWDWALRLVTAVVMSAVAAWAIYRIFDYITTMQKRYYDVAENLSSRGQATRPSIVSARMPGLAAREGARGEEVPAKELQVKGPNTVIVGTTAEFTAVTKTGSSEEPATDATWTVAPEAQASLSQGTGPTVRVTARQQGAFELVVKAPGPSGTIEVHFPVAAVAPVGQATDLPFVGEGWGTIVLAILFGIIVALLGLSRVLSTSLVGTLLGALLGYIFGTATSGGSKAGGEGAAGGSKSAGTNQGPGNQ